MMLLLLLLLRMMMGRRTSAAVRLAAVLRWVRVLIRGTALLLLLLLLSLVWISLPLLLGRVGA